MKKHNIKVNIILIVIALFYIFVFIPQNKLLLAAQMYAEPDSYAPTSNYNDVVNKILDFIGSRQENKSNEEITPTPNSTIPNPTGPYDYQPEITSALQPSLPKNSANIFPYRQCDYPNSPMHNGCNICKAGCGIVSVSIILSKFAIMADPVTVEKKYEEFGFNAGCDGTYMYDAKTMLERYGLKTSNYIFASNYGYSINSVAQDIRDKVKNGWVVLALGQFCLNGCGHFFVITDIDSSNQVTSYDPYYEPNSRNQPINYTSRYPFPLYKYAFGVRKE